MSAREQRVASADEDAGAQQHPVGPREKIVSCVRPAIGVEADVAVRHDDLVARVGGHVDVERAHLPALE